MKYYGLLRTLVCVAVLSLVCEPGTVLAGVKQQIDDWNPKMFHMETSNEGWAVVNSRTEVIRTEDGGMTWRNVSPVSLKPNGNSTISSVCYLNSASAWVSVSSDNTVKNNYQTQFLDVYHTLNPGHEWRHTKYPCPITVQNWHGPNEFHKCKSGLPHDGN